MDVVSTLSQWWYISFNVHCSFRGGGGGGWWKRLLAISWNKQISYLRNTLSCYIAVIYSDATTADTEQIIATVDWYDYHFRDQLIECTWWHHQIETFSALLALCEGNPTPSKTQVARSFDVYFDLRVSKRLCKKVEKPVMRNAFALIMTSL